MRPLLDATVTLPQPPDSTDRESGYTPVDLEASRRRIALLENLSDNTELLFERVRHDHSIIERSKFARLRAIWENLKSILRVGTTPLSRNAPGLPTLQPPSAPNAWLEAIDSPEHYERIAEAFQQRLPALTFEGPPLVSIVIPVYNNIAVTMRCLASIAELWFNTPNVEIVIVDDCSKDKTASVLATIPGIRVLRNMQNCGFLMSCNRAIANASGKYVFLLNNDTVVKHRWLDELVATAEKDPRIGAVGSKLVYPDGRLQEAGNILWRDGSGWQYGHLDDSEDPLYNFVREVDYCSAAALLVRTDLLRQLDGFDTCYTPAYYEDSDLCMSIRALGYKVVYQPRSVVIHYEGLTSGRTTQSGIKRFQDVNAPKFVEKWRAVLEKHHFENDPKNVYRAARRHLRSPKVLVINDSPPLYDKDAGSQRLMRIIRILVNAEVSVAFHSVSFLPIQPYTAELQALGVEVLHYHDGLLTAEDRLQQLFSNIDLAWICRPDVAEDFVPWLRNYPQVKRVYDTVDLHFVRMRRQAQIEGRPLDGEWKQMRDLELAWARECDATITVTPHEKQALEDLGVSNVYVIPTIHDPSARTRNPYERSRDLLFIGGYGHPPNVDAAEWAVSEIMPLIWEHDPEIKLMLLGSDPPPRVLALRSERVIIPGYIPDIERYFLEHRVFVAPLRFGAGLKGKIGEAMSYKLPVVTTPIGAEGFDLTDGVNVLIAESSKDFAAAVVRLYCDPELWQHLSNNSTSAIEKYSTSSVRSSVLSLVGDLAPGHVEAEAAF